MDYVNKECLESHENITIRVEMDGMWSFHRDKKHQIWLWRAIDHESGVVTAFWFGTMGRENLDKLLGLLKPLNPGKVYADGNYAYDEHFSPEALTVTKKNTQKIERKHLSLISWRARLVRRGIRFSKMEQTHKM